MGRSQARVLTTVAALVASTAVLAGIPGTATAAPTPVSQTYAYSASTQSFTVPAGITQLTVSLVGGEGGLGGPDNTAPTPGGYKGVVSGTIDVTPGTVLTIGVGKGGSSGIGRGSATVAPASPGGTNPISGYAGGNGGVAGNAGSSGDGAGGGAATVVSYGATTLVAGGGGGGGGSGQFGPLTGRPGEATYRARLDGVVSTSGQVGLNTMTFCSPLTSCDGGASGGGGGGAAGGARGAVEYGAGSATEYFGYGGYPGSNSTANISTLTTAYQYYAANANNGSVTISYVSGSPSAPTSVAGTAGNAAVDLTWVAPATTGGAAVTDYIVEYSTNGTTWTTFSDGTSTATGTTVTGLTNGTPYFFRVSAVNSFGTGNVSATSAAVTPSNVPTAPTIGSIAPGNGSLSVPFSGATAVSPITGYDYSVDGGAWISAGTTTSPLTVSGLTNGTSYSVRVRAVNAIGAGTASAPVSAVPATTPGAPSVTSATTGSDRAVITFAPGSSGGLTITGYEYQLNGTGSWVSTGTTTSPFTVTGLTDGTVYTLRLRALNALGAGTPSPAASLTTSSVPGAPTITSITPGDRSLSVAFTAAATGGLSITGYEYQLNGAGSWVSTSGTSGPFLISGLTNGTATTVRLRAVNAVGNGAASTGVSGTPRTIPGAPTITDLSSADNGLTVDFTAPASDGGSTITTYQYSTDAGVTWRTRDDGQSGSPLGITTLSSDGTTPVGTGTDLPVELRAVNAAGAGAASSIVTVSDQTVPAAPSIQSVTGRPGSLLVTIVPPANGGATIDTYEYRLDQGPWVNTGTLSNWFSVAGLTNGTTYAVEVRASNAIGASAPSAVRNGTPVAAPGIAVIDGVTPLDRSLRIAASVADNGGSPVTGWDYTTDGGLTWATAAQTTSPIVITALSSNSATPLSNSTSYPVAVRARNAVGPGGASATVSVAPSATPSAPAVTVTPLDGRLQVAYTISSDGGSAITDVQYRINGGTWVTAGSTASPFIISGLTNGTSYAVEVRGTNVRGDGAVSPVVNGVPRTVPDAPTAVAVSGDTASAAVTWSAPAFNGGSAITGYTATAWTAPNGGSSAGTCTGAGTSCTITGLTNATTYYVSVTATNVAGTGVPSSPRVAVTPLARPSAPVLNTLTPANTYLTAAFTAGAAGSSAITGYQYQLNGGAWVNASGTTSPITLSGLTNGTAYSVALRAVSAAGVGATSNVLSATPYALPDVPDSATIVGTGGSGSLVLTWAAPNDNGRPITGYNVVLWTAATLGSQAYTCSTTGALTCTFTGLTNGTVYYATVDATNLAGTTARSNPRIPVGAGTAPGAPTAVAGTSGDGQVALTWTAGTAGSGAAVTDYLISYSTDGTNYTAFTDAVSTARATTVTGLTNGTAYTFKVRAVSPSGNSPLSAASAAVTPLAAGTTPTFGAVTRTATGFTTTITNYNAAVAYSFAATNGGTVAQSGSALTVTGVPAGVSSTVTVTATRSGYTTVSAPVTGAALAAGTVPTFGTVVRTTDGFTVPVANYDAAVTYSASTTAGIVAVTGSTVGVTGLAPGASAVVTLTATRSGYTTVSANVTGTALVTGIAPTFGPVTPTANGWVVEISNYDATTSYALSTSGTAVATRSGSTLTVTGLAPGASTTVGVLAAKSGSAPASSSVSGAALLAGTVPALTAAQRTLDGYTTAIIGVDPAVAYSVAVTAGSAAIDADGVVTVTGLTPGQAATVTVTATRAGYTTTSANLTAAALQTGTVPVLSNPVRTADGFTTTVVNADPAVTYSASSDLGSAVIADGTVTVTGLAPGASATVTVVATRNGFSTRSAQATGTALDAGTVPVLSDPVRTADGFTTTVLDPDPAVSYSVSSDQGSATIVDGAVTVTGLTPGQTATVTVTATRAGFTTRTAAVTGAALLTGLVPAFTTAQRTVDGYTTAVIDLDPAFTYTVTTDAGSAAIDADGIVSVTGLDPGASATVTVTVTRAGYTTGSGQLTAAALETGTPPVLSDVTRTADGFTTVIVDPRSDTLYTVTSDVGTAAIVDGVITVTGLEPGQSATVTVTATRAGFTTQSAGVTGAALETGTVPTFSDPVRTVDGFTASVVDPDPAVTYTVTSDVGTAVIVDGVITVTGLAPGQSATVTVTATRDGFTTQTADVTGSALETGTVPVLSDPVRTVDGFTVTVLNADSAVTYTVTSDVGTAVIVDGVITVTGLQPGQSATVTVTATRGGFTTQTADVTGAALETGTVPTFSDPVRTVDGFTASVVDPDPAVTYTATSDVGTAVVVDGVVTVTGLEPGQSATVTVTATRGGFTTRTADVTGTALETGTVPTFSGPVRTADGFTVTVLNADSAVTYTVTSDVGTAVVVDGVVTVTGLEPGQSATVTVTATRGGFTTHTADVSGIALETGTVPVLSIPVRTVDGFSTTVVAPDPAVTYTVTSDLGTAAIVDGLITVTGLEPGQTATVTVTASRDGFTTQSAAVAGTALGTGTVPVLSDPVRTVDGFTATVVNPDPAVTYTVTTTVGTATVVNGLVTVTGLTPGQTATVTLTATRLGFTTQSADLTSTALETGILPVFSDLVRTADGFTTTVMTVDPAVTYTVTSTVGTATVVNGLVTVTGLTPGQTATVTLTATRLGFTTRTADATGTALGAGTVPVLSAPTPTENGFTATVANPDPDVTYSVTTDLGVATITNGVITVTDLTPGQIATVTVAATRGGFTTTTGTVTGAPLGTLVPLSLSAPIRTADGFTATVQNVDAAVTYSATSSAGTVAITDGLITVTGLTPGQTATVTVTAVRSGFTTRTAPVTGTALDTGTPPALSIPVRTADGFTTTVVTVDPAVTYTVASDLGTAVIADGLITVIGLTPGQTATVTVTAVRSGFTTRTATATGTALLAGIPVELSEPTQVAGGFQVTIVGPDPDFTYTATVDVAGATVTVVDGVVTVAGLTPGQTATVTVVANRVGYATTDDSVLGAAPAAAELTVTGGDEASTTSATPVISGHTDAPAGSTVTVTVNGQVLTTTVGPDGNWSVTPASLPDGDYDVVVSITVLGVTSTVTQRLSVDSTPAPTTTVPTVPVGTGLPGVILPGGVSHGTGGLAYTGLDARLPGAVGTALLVLGGLLLGVARRRRPESAVTTGDTGNAAPPLG